MGLGELSPSSQVSKTWEGVLMGMDAKKADLAGLKRFDIVESSPSRLIHMANAHWSFALVLDLGVPVWHI